MNIIKINGIVINNRGCKAKILSRSDSKPRYFNIVFKDKYKHIMEVRKDHIISGVFKNPYHPLVFGVGYFGAGKYSQKKNIKHYNKWIKILERCYDIKFENKNKSYKGCKVSKEWHNFQNFAKWLDDNNWNMKDEIDKDLICFGNKTYNPEMCSLIPKRLNCQLVRFKAKGFCKDSESNKWIASVRIKGKSKKLGRFNKEKDARNAYVKAKRMQFDIIIDEWKSKLDPKIINLIKKIKNTYKEE